MGNFTLGARAIRPSRRHRSGKRTREDRLPKTLLGTIEGLLDGDPYPWCDRSHKQSNGETYCRGKTLVVFLDTPVAGNWFPNEVAKALPTPLLSAAVWVVGFSTVQDGSYVYNLTPPDVAVGNAPAFLLWIALDFDAWQVEQVQ